MISHRYNLNGKTHKIINHEMERIINMYTYVAEENSGQWRHFQYNTKLRYAETDS